MNTIKLDDQNDANWNLIFKMNMSIVQYPLKKFIQTIIFVMSTMIKGFWSKLGIITRKSWKGAK